MLYYPQSSRGRGDEGATGSNMSLPRLPEFKSFGEASMDGVWGSLERSQEPIIVKWAFRARKVFPKNLSSQFWCEFLQKPFLFCVREARTVQIILGKPSDDALPLEDFFSPQGLANAQHLSLTTGRYAFVAIMPSHQSVLTPGEQRT